MAGRQILFHKDRNRSCLIAFTTLGASYLFEGIRLLEIPSRADVGVNVKS